MVNGLNNHRNLVEKGREFVKKRDDCEFIDSETEYEPDICLKDSSLCDGSDFSEVWFEAELSTVQRPSNIIRKITQAAEVDAKVVFLVKAVEDKRVDYYADRIDNIIGPPSLMSHYKDKNSYCLYNSQENLRTDSGNIVLTEQNNRVEWIYNDKLQRVSCELNSDSVSIENPSAGLKISDEDAGIVGYQEGEEFLVQFDGETSYDSIRDSPYKPVRKPDYPFSIPRSRVEKVVDSVEFLIFGENVTYHRVHPKLSSYIDGLD